MCLMRALTVYRLCGLLLSLLCGCGSVGSCLIVEMIHWLSMCSAPGYDRVKTAVFKERVVFVAQTVIKHRSIPRSVWNVMESCTVQAEMYHQEEV